MYIYMYVAPPPKLTVLPDIMWECTWRSLRPLQPLVRFRLIPRRFHYGVSLSLTAFLTTSTQHEQSLRYEQSLPSYLKKSSWRANAAIVPIGCLIT